MRYYITAIDRDSGYERTQVGLGLLRAIYYATRIKLTAPWLLVTISKARF